MAYSTNGYWNNCQCQTALDFICCATRIQATNGALNAVKSFWIQISPPSLELGPFHQTRNAEINANINAKCNKKKKTIILHVPGVSTAWHLVSSTHAVVQNDTFDAVSQPRTSPHRHQTASICPYLSQHPAVPTSEAVSK
jgi:hypothetical protein